MPNEWWRTIISLVHKIRLHSRWGKGMAESFSRKIKARTAERWMRIPVWPSSCVTPAGTSNELDIQSEWEENTHTHTIGHHSSHNSPVSTSSLMRLHKRDDPYQCHTLFRGSRAGKVKTPCGTSIVVCKFQLRQGFAWKVWGLPLRGSTVSQPKMRMRGTNGQGIDWYNSGTQQVEMVGSQLNSTDRTDDLGRIT